MKRKHIILLILFSLCILTSCTAQQNSDADLSQMELFEFYSDTANPIYSFDDLDNAEVIIRGKALPNQENLTTTYGIDGMQGRTYVDFEVLDVYKGDINKGDIIKIEEHYYYEEDDNGNQILYISYGYIPSQKGQEYILFLLKNTFEGSKADYYPIGIEMGKYAYASESAYRSKVNVTTSSRYNTIREEVLRTYK